MGHGPAKNRSTSDQLTEFFAQAARPGSITHLAVEQFENEYQNTQVSDLDESSWNEAERARVQRFSTQISQPVVPAPWEASRDEFARWLLAAQSLIGRTNLAATNGVLSISVNGNPKDFGRPNYSSPLDVAKADLEKKFDNEVWLQDINLVPFMIQVIKVAVPSTNYNMKFLGLAVDIAAQAIPAILFDAKARVGAKRPSELNSSHPVALPIPDHSSWPGGHAFWCGALTELLHEAFAIKVVDPKALKNKLRKAAKRIADNRVRAGLHWPKDTDDGIAMGEFVMNQWIKLSQETATAATPGYAGDAGDLWRLLKQI